MSGELLYGEGTLAGQTYESSISKKPFVFSVLDREGRDYCIFCIFCRRTRRRHRDTSHMHACVRHPRKIQKSESSLTH